MSALGQKQTFAVQNVMSALPPKADMCGAVAHVRFVPIANIPLETLLDTHEGFARGERLFPATVFLSALDTFRDSHRTQTRRRGIARATCHRRLGRPSTASRLLFLIFWPSR